jgi:hypothetical protein
MQIIDDSQDVGRHHDDPSIETPAHCTGPKTLPHSGRSSLTARMPDVRLTSDRTWNESLPAAHDAAVSFSGRNALGRSWRCDSHNGQKQT